MNQENRYEWSFTLKFIILFRTTVLRKLFDIRFWYKHCNFSRGCPLVKMASKTVTRPILKFSSVGSREGAQGARPSLIFRPNWGLKGRKIFFETDPPYLRVWMTPPPYLKVWVCHCLAKGYLSTGHSTITYIRYLSKLTWSRFRW